MKITHALAGIAVLSSSLASIAFASSDPVDILHPDPVCDGAGPQTPRDIDSSVGENSRVFSLAPSSDEMNLCNIHFHNNAEHKAKDFSIFAGEGDKAGYQCKISKTLSKSELKKPKGDVCNGLAPGDTIEVHWVHTSCDIDPGGWA